MGKKQRGRSYCPLHHFTENPQEAVSTIYETIDANFPDVLKGNVIKYILAELCDNIQEHSEFTHATLLAQYFPHLKYIDLGVIDNGITIPGSYEQYDMKFPSDANAIEQAIRGVSTKQEKGRGHGLPSSLSIGVEELKGDVYILSRRGALVHRSGASKLYKLEGGGLLGTAVYFRFKVPSERPDIMPYIS